MEEIIAQGAEALLIKEKNRLIKRRISKGYRHPKIDGQLRARRTRSEAKIISKVSSVVNAPVVIKSDEKKREIEMEFLPGQVLSETLDSLERKEALNICREIGKSTALMHNINIIHGDLTTSNMMLFENKVYFIDFGLSFHSSRKEDKAVDIHLLKQALESRHFNLWKEYFNAVLNGYKLKSKEGDEIEKRLEKVEARGRYKGKH